MVLEENGFLLHGKLGIHQLSAAPAATAGAGWEQADEGGRTPIWMDGAATST